MLCVGGATAKRTRQKDRSPNALFVVVTCDLPLLHLAGVWLLDEDTTTVFYPAGPVQRKSLAAAASRRSACAWIDES